MQEKPGAGTMADIIGGKKPTVQSEFIQFDRFTALVIDDIGAMRHALRSQLEWMGINSVKGVANAEEALRQEIGDEAFFAFLHAYANQNIGTIATGQSFFDLLGQYSQKDISSLKQKFFDPNQP